MKSPAVGKLTYALWEELKNSDKINNDEFMKRRRIEFKRGLIFSFPLMLHCVAYGQIPNGKSPQMVEPIGFFDVKENLSEGERKAREIKRIADNMIFKDNWLDEAPYPFLNTSEAKKTSSTFLKNKEIKKLKKQGLYLIAELTVEKDGSISEIKIFQSDAIELKKDKHVKDIMRIFKDNTPDSPWRQMTLETSRYKYAWVSTNEKANNAVRSYINGLKWSVGKLYELPTRTGMYYVSP